MKFTFVEQYLKHQPLVCIAKRSNVFLSSHDESGYRKAAGSLHSLEQQKIALLGSLFRNQVICAVQMNRLDLGAIDKSQDFDVTSGFTVSPLKSSGSRIT